MSKQHVLFIIGALIVFLPFLGIPYIFKSILILAAGLSVSLIAILIHVEKRAPVRKVTRTRRKVSPSTVPDPIMTSQLPIEQAHDYQIDASDTQ